MNYTKRELAYLQETKLRESMEDVPIYFNYLYIYQTEMIFIQSVRKKYKVMCSPQCHETALYFGNNFDCVFESDNLEETKIEFHKMVFRSIRRHSGW